MTYSAIIVGAGHNGLVAASYLARQGARVLVLERRDFVGGACITEELFPTDTIDQSSQPVGRIHQCKVLVRAMQ